MLVTTFAAVAAPGTPAHADVPEYEPCTTDAGVTFGSAGPAVGCLQFQLLVHGTFQGRLVSIFDQATSDAVVRYQLDNPPLRVDGHVSQTLLKELGIFSGVDLTPPPPCLADADLRFGDRGPGVTCLQDTLFDFGYLTQLPDGVFGTGTSTALTAFQQRLRLTADGVANSRTLAALGIWSGKSNHVTDAFPDRLWPALPQPEPFWNLTAEGIPRYGDRSACNRAEADEIARQFGLDGADPLTQQWAVYIASREGGCDFRAVNINMVTRDDSHCTFQLNALAGMFEPSGELGRRGWNIDSVKSSLAACADAASDLWTYCGRGPWTPPYACAPPWKGDLGEGDA